MSAYKSFAVIGAGTIGLPIVEALAARNASVVLLSRPGSSKKTIPAGVPVIEVDFTNVPALSAALQEHKVDVVLSTVGTKGLDVQRALVDAAKLAGVKLFAPSEYGFPTEGQTEGVLGEKMQIIDQLRQLGIPTVQFYTGLFTEVIPLVTGYNQHGKIRIIGKGEAFASFTAIADIAGFVAYVLTTLPPAKLENREFRIEGERARMKDLGEIFNTTVEHLDQVPKEEADPDLLTMLLEALGSGVGSTGWDVVNNREGSGADGAGSANVLWPGHHWKSIKEVLKL
ncbi:hypothetical protein C8F04DRAFT_1078395 [Mycena alexandri]|uniref:NmrA-like domain-containing protein n=1 Tax=Mycena alexandri TaxID=1745969 RepID=A0AAD6TDU0_9AGAR|nr:hypothetical protein C8F04DRAFT_1078395 [Mycena alexandri]